MIATLERQAKDTTHWSQMSTAAETGLSNFPTVSSETASWAATAVFDTLSAHANTTRYRCVNACTELRRHTPVKCRIGK
ncbi:hypothetical protein [Rhodococcus koreensis]